jgi:hypothetical protein
VDIYHILGYAGAVLTGLVLGLLGGGGALFSIPVLVYLFRLNASVATGYSLFLIGVAAISGTVQNIRKKLVDYPSVAYYGIPSMIAVYVVRRFFIHQLPDVLFTIGSYQVDKNQFILTLLATVMFGVAYNMITNKKTEGEQEQHATNIPKLVIYATLVGAFVGTVGAGGGFLMVPALINFANLPMKKAVGTSLLLVAINSFIGFAGDLGGNPHMDWPFLLIFSGFCITGVLVGSYLVQFVDGQKLKKWFGWFVLVVAVYMVVRETFLK